MFGCIFHSPRIRSNYIVHRQNEGENRMTTSRISGIAFIFAALLVSGTAVSAQLQPKGQKSTVEARLQRLEDIEEIRLLLLDYGRFLDARDLAAYSRLFAKDGEWVGGFGSAKG